LNGKKHGHGKLLMADGSYYEGEFKDGEICGRGFKKWQKSGNTYTGSFDFGELDGEGVLDYNDIGAQYSGEFVRNIRQGEGVLRERFGEEYIGSFYNDKRHGKGKQIFSNGDYYDGDWINGQRQGHGILNCMNGSYYEGQWRADMFNGLGKLIHPSGVSFKGIWMNDRPLHQPSRLSLLDPSTENLLEIKQNELFSLKLEIVDEEGNPIKGEIGRSFEIKAGHRNPFHITKSFQENSLLKIIESDGVSSTQIFTPFGYNVLNYPLTEIPEELVDEFNRLHNHVNTRESFEDISDTETDIDEDKIIKKHSITQKTDEDKADRFPHLNMTSLSIVQSDEINKTELQNTNVLNHIRSCENIPSKTLDSEEPLQFSNLFLPNPRDVFSELIKDSEEKDEDKNSKKITDEENDFNSDDFLDNKKRNKLGNYVIIISDVTTPPFLGYRLPDFFLEVKVIQPSQEEDIKNKSHQ